MYKYIADCNISQNFFHQFCTFSQFLFGHFCTFSQLLRGDRCIMRYRQKHVSDKNLVEDFIICKFAGK